MQYLIKLTPEQVLALGEWVEQGDAMKEVLISARSDADGVIRVAQGDERASIAVNGTITDENYSTSVLLP